MPWYLVLALGIIVGFCIGIVFGAICTMAADTSDPWKEE